MQDEKEIIGMYEVEKILDRRRRKNKIQYLIKWLDWDLPQHNTWEPEENLETVMDMVKAFNKEMDKKESQAKKKEEPKKLFKTLEQNALKTIPSKKQSTKKQQRENKMVIQSSPQSSSSSPVEKLQPKNKTFKTKVKYINFPVLKEGKLYYDVDVMNAKGQTLGVQLLSSEEVRESNQQQLMNYLKRKLLEAAE